MTQDEIIELAKQAGIHTDWEISAYKNELQHFAKLIAEREREACAVDADWCIQNHLEQHIPERIRARGQS